MKNSMVCFLLVSWLCISVNAWSWDQNSNENERKIITDPIDVEVTSEDTKITSKRETNLTEIERVVDSILNSDRQGRNIKGYDELYADPTVQEVLQKDIRPDDPEARNLIKERLCSLGLMQCYDDVSEKRPYIAPEELVYAQPVDIKPIGQPIPSIAVKGPSRAIYGPPRPGNFNKNGPLYGPPKPGYGRPQVPNRPPYGLPVPPKYYGVGLPPKPYGPPRPVYGPDLIEIDNPAVDFSSASLIQKQEIKKKYEGVIGPTGDVQQHVHHHYHHNPESNGEVSNKFSKILANNPPQIFKPSEQLSSAFINDDYRGHNGVHTAVNYNGLGSNVGIKPVVEYPNQLKQGPQTFGANAQSLYTQVGLGTSPNSYGQGSFNSESSNIAGNNFGSTSSNIDSSLIGYGGSGLSNSFGASVGAFGATSDFYKKELTLDGNFNNLRGYDKYQGIRNENYDCICVPYDQCPSQDIIGRKDDLYLPLDPRNLKSDIQAEEERIIDYSNEMNKTIPIKQEMSGNITTENISESSKKVKREATTEASTEKSKIEARQNNYNQKNIIPTFGVSFGLPQQYPVNYIHPQYGPQNPFVNHAGIDLGLVSVNPLVSVQLTKNDYGEKIVKPYVNLHVTPNNFLVNKVTDFFLHKKHHILNNHYHNHVYNPVPHFPHDTLYHEHRPPYYKKPYIHSPVSEYYGAINHNHPLIFGLENEGHFIDRNYRSSRTLDRNNTQPNWPKLNSNFKQLIKTDLTYYPNNNSTIRHDRHDGQFLYQQAEGKIVKFPTNRRRRDVNDAYFPKRQVYYGQVQANGNCGPRHVCCKRPIRPVIPNIDAKQCGVRHSQGVNGRIKNPVYVDGDSEFGEYPWQVAILKKDPKESIYICGGTLIDSLNIITAAHCVKQYTSHDLRVRLGEWDVNHDVEFFPYIERDIGSLHVHPEFYAGTLYNDFAILRMDKPIDFGKYPHISPACLPSPHEDYSGARCWTTGWGKDAFGDFGKYQNILKEVDVPVIPHGECQQRLKNTRLGYDFQLHPGFVCAGGEEGKDACKGDGGGPMVCERGGTWQVVGVVSWGIGCGQSGVPGVYVNVAHYLDWIRQITRRY